MKTKMNTKSLLPSILVLALILAFWISVPSWSEESAEGAPMMQATMMEHCTQMMERKQKMMGSVKAQDADLSEQLAAMNSAPADQKVDLMAALLTKMVEQRVAMNAQRTRMQDEMMTHMMEHMQMGKDSMSQCPMMKGIKGMKGMKGMDEKAEDAHQDHQVEPK